MTLARGVWDGSDARLERVRSTGTCEARRVLIVDHDDHEASALSQDLRTQGFEAVRAYDGVEARAILQRETPSLVFLDLDVPRLTAVELLALMRLDGLAETVPVLVRSRLGDSAAVARASEWDVLEVVDGRAPVREVSSTIISWLGRL